jgi:hypothetical protein
MIRSPWASLPRTLSWRPKGLSRFTRFWRPDGPLGAEKNAELAKSIQPSERPYGKKKRCLGCVQLETAPKRRPTLPALRLRAFASR